MQPDVRKGHVLLAAARRRGRGAGGAHDVQQPTSRSLKKKGAPIDFVPVQPVVARPQGIGVARNAPHPNAARAVRRLRALARGPEAVRIDGPRAREHQGDERSSTISSSRVIGPVTVLDEQDKWEKLWERAVHPRRRRSDETSCPPTGSRSSRSSSCSGCKHGLDPDHLVAIDGLTRFNARSRGLSRWSGLFFSARPRRGGDAGRPRAWRPSPPSGSAPAWLRGRSAPGSRSRASSCSGVANLAMACARRAARPVPPVGLRGRWLVRAAHARRAIPVLIAAVGAAFALSFDTHQPGAALLDDRRARSPAGSSPRCSASSSPPAWRSPTR